MIDTHDPILSQITRAAAIASDVHCSFAVGVFALWPLAIYETVNHGRRRRITNAAVTRFQQAVNAFYLTFQLAAIDDYGYQRRRSTKAQVFLNMERNHFVCINWHVQ